MQTLVNDTVAVDSLTITRITAVPETMHAEPGSELRWGNHPADHHIVVVKGSCSVLGRRIGAGGSAYVPAGLDHILKAGTRGCTFVSFDSAHETI